MMFEGFPDYETHVMAEGIRDVDSISYPDKAYLIAGDLSLDPEDHDSFGEEALTVYRGDTEKVTESLRAGGRFCREFPIYFTETERSARIYAQDKIDDTDKVLWQIEVPYENIVVPEENQSVYEQGLVSIPEETFHFIGTNIQGGIHHLELVASDIPEEWIEIEKIEP